MSEKCPKCGVIHDWEAFSDDEGGYHVFAGGEPNRITAHNVPAGAIRLIGFQLAERLCLQSQLGQASGHIAELEDEREDLVTLLGMGGEAREETDTTAADTVFRIMQERNKLQADNERLRVERLQLAKLAASTPQFSNPIVVAAIVELRDRVLDEAAKAKGGD